MVKGSWSHGLLYNMKGFLLYSCRILLRIWFPWVAQASNIETVLCITLMSASVLIKRLWGHQGCGQHLPQLNSIIKYSSLLITGTLYFLQIASTPFFPIPFPNAIGLSKHFFIPLSSRLSSHDLIDQLLALHHWIISPVPIQIISPIPDFISKSCDECMKNPPARMCISTLSHGAGFRGIRKCSGR